MAPSGNTFFFPWEVTLMEWLQTHLGSTGISIISFFSVFGGELLLILIMGFLYWCYDKKLARTVGLSVVMGLVWNAMFKNIALRRRPYFDHENIKIGSAGRRRRKGIRPTVRGVVQNATDHPHGGGDGGRHGTGKAPRTPWGQLTLGYRTRHNKKTNKMIVRSRHEGKRK